ncbi:hypothetical protein ACE38W_14480 [Chitinophaga sp. Hz27]|uniref:hypothetical protein n=1 Tax=Chitinophaga sp. Hz27 TaxID=3347169 RepID=UPI0035DE8B70
MKRIVIIILTLLYINEGQSQSWTPGQYSQLKGVISDSAIRLPRLDTVWLGGNKDSIGALVYRAADQAVYLKVPGLWKKMATGGTALSPGGANTELQFNDSGVFGGMVGITYNKSTGNTSFGSTPGTAKLNVAGDIHSLGTITSEYASDFGGRILLKTTTKTGLQYDKWYISNFGPAYGNYLGFFGFTQDGTDAAIRLKVFDAGNVWVSGKVSAQPATADSNLVVLGQVRDSIKNRVGIVADVTALCNYSGLSSAVQVNDSLRGGTFNYVSSGLSVDSGVVFPATGKGSGYWQRVYDRSNGVNIFWYGPANNGVTDDVAKIQAAVDRSFSDSVGLVKINKLRAKTTKAITVPSNTTIEAYGSYIELASGSNDDILRNADVTNGNKNIRIFGGTWNGRGWSQTRTIAGTVAASKFCFGFFFHKCDNVEVGNVEVDSTRSWGIAAVVSKNIHVHDVRFEQNPFLPGSTNVGLAENGDGFTFLADNVVAENISGFTNDDMVGVGSGQPIFGGVLAPFESHDYSNIMIRNIRPEIRTDTIPTWRAVGLYSIGGKWLRNITVENTNGVSTSGGVIIADPMGNMGNFSNIQLHNINTATRSVSGYSATQFGIITVEAANVDHLVVDGGSRNEKQNTSHIRITDSSTVNNLIVSNISLQYNGYLGRLVDDGGKVKNIDISNVIMKDSAGIIGQRLYDRGASTFNTDTLLLRVSNCYVTRPTGFSSISTGVGKISYASWSIRIGDTSELAGRNGDYAIFDNIGPAHFQRGGWRQVLNPQTLTVTGPEALHVTNSAGYISFYNSANTTRTGFLQFDAVNGARIRTDINAQFSVETNAMERFVITGGGTVIINGLYYVNGSGSPEGTVTAPIGSWYSDKSGGVPYFKVSGTGNTGWKQITINP